MKGKRAIKKRDRLLTARAIIFVGLLLIAFYSAIRLQTEKGHYKLVQQDYEAVKEAYTTNHHRYITALRAASVEKELLGWKGITGRLPDYFNIVANHPYESLLLDTFKFKRFLKVKKLPTSAQSHANEYALSSSGKVSLSVKSKKEGHGFYEQDALLNRINEGNYIPFTLETDIVDENDEYSSENTDIFFKTALANEWLWKM